MEVDYHDFVLQFGLERGGGFAVSVLESPAGEGEGFFQLPKSQEEWGRIRLDLARACRNLAPAEKPSAPPFPAREIGADLFRALFSDRIGRLYEKSRGLVNQRNGGLRLKLRYRIGSRYRHLTMLHNLPWELLYDPDREDFLVLNRSTPIVRYLEVAQPVSSVPRPAAMHILLVISNPDGFGPLELSNETRCIKNAWQENAAVKLDFLDHAQVEALREALLRGPVHGFHFMGHGDLDPTTGKGRLFFESHDHSPNPVSGETLATLLKDVSSLRFVFLNACETANSLSVSEADYLTGTAAALVLGGVPAVLAMQFPVSDKAAIDFSRVVHGRLAAGDTIEAAVTEGRRAVYAAHPDGLEWAIPVLFSRVRDGHLFELPRTPEYQDVRIEGTWLATITFPKGEVNKHRMTLKDSGIAISGETICYEGYSKNIYGKDVSYQIRGTFRNRILTCTYKVNDAKSFEEGAMVLMLCQNGRALKGYVTYYDDLDEEIMSAGCEWRRNDTTST